MQHTTGIRTNAGLSLPSPTACVAGTLGVGKAPQLRGVLEYDADPSATALAKAHAGHAVQHPWAAEAVTCFAEVQKDPAARLTYLLQYCTSSKWHTTLSPIQRSGTKPV